MTVTINQATSATFLQQDTTTEGNWINTYGTQGYEVIGNATSLPSYATVTPSGQKTYTWTTSTTDPRALQDASGTGRIAAAWYSATSFTVDVDLTDGKTHDLELYFVDWDTPRGASKSRSATPPRGPCWIPRRSRRSIAGVYDDWKVSGNMRDHDHAGSPVTNAVLSGLFIDPPTQLRSRRSPGPTRRISSTARP